MLNIRFAIRPVYHQFQTIHKYPWAFWRTGSICSPELPRWLLASGSPVPSLSPNSLITTWEGILGWTPWTRTILKLSSSWTGQTSLLPLSYRVLRKDRTRWVFREVPELVMGTWHWTIIFLSPLSAWTKRTQSRILAPCLNICPSHTIF